jgi:hypothetical protein
MKVRNEVQCTRREGRIEDYEREREMRGAGRKVRRIFEN